MSENETAVEETTKDEYVYDVKIEDGGPGVKKVSVEIPEQRIADKLEEQFVELRREATLPGFRPGHAPRKLVEKRFSNDVREQVRRTLVTESYEQAVEKNSLQVIGEPKFDDPESIKLPETGPLIYSFEIEVQPEFALPALTGLKVKKPKAEVSEAHVDQAMQNLREQQGALLPVEDRGIETGDYLIGDVHLKVEGNVVGHQHGAQIVARPGRVGGIQVDDLDAKLAGLKPGETREFTVHAPQTHPNEQIRDKDVAIELKLEQIKRLELAEINDEFLDSLGFTNQQELRDALKEQMVERVEADVKQNLREQVSNYLLDNTPMELPEALSTRQADRIVLRRKMELMMRGTAEEEATNVAEGSRTQAVGEAIRELKLFFILQKVATEADVDVSEAEMNGQISIIAAQRNKRLEKLKSEMAADGTLSNLYVQLREQKAIDKVLETAEVEEVELPLPGAAAAENIEAAGDTAPAAEAEAPKSE